MQLCISRVQERGVRIVLDNACMLSFDFIYSNMHNYVRLFHKLGLICHIPLIKTPYPVLGSLRLVLLFLWGFAALSSSVSLRYCLCCYRYFSDLILLTDHPSLISSFYAVLSSESTAVKTIWNVLGTDMESLYYSPFLLYYLFSQLPSLCSLYPSISAGTTQGLLLCAVVSMHSSCNLFTAGSPPPLSLLRSLKPAICHQWTSHTHWSSPTHQPVSISIVQSLSATTNCQSRHTRTNIHRVFISSILPTENACLL